ncbi:MAG: hypothetical protein GY696_15190, partial [Gammaproteobacteria bacterium]|nr:hypothetical protein [Gammaproteobacteria bacterium]
MVDWEAADWPKAQVSLIQNPDGSPRELKEIIGSAPSVDEAAHILTCAIQSAQMEALSDSSAVKHVRLRRASCPWMSKELFRKVQRKQRTYTEFRRDQSSKHRSAMIHARKAAKAACRAAKADYVRTCFEQTKDIRSFWSTVRKLSPNKSGFSSILELGDGSSVQSAAAKAAEFSQEFSKNFNADDVPPPEMNPVDEWDSSWNCSEVEVFNIIRGLDNQSAVGLDDISPRTLKNCHEEIVPALAALINRSFAEGKFPSSWKHARISPIPKVPGTSIISEHRPISVLPSLSKVAERC